MIPCEAVWQLTHHQHHFKAIPLFLLRRGLCCLLHNAIAVCLLRGSLSCTPACCLHVTTYLLHTSDVWCKQQNEGWCTAAAYLCPNTTTSSSIPAGQDEREMLKIPILIEIEIFRQGRTDLCLSMGLYRRVCATWPKASGPRLTA